VATDERSGTVCAVVVTHNRRDLLEECLDAVLAQTRGVDHVLVVDNASTDGTGELVASRFPQVELLALPRNEGGAGGFHEGMRLATEQGWEWLWLMDDDTIPRADALERLLERLDELDGLPEPIMLGSKAVWSDGRWHPMNFVSPRTSDMQQFLDAGTRGLFAFRTSTFVSLLVRSDAVRRYGLPHKHYFIWSDDVEWTARVLMHEAGYLVGSSVVEHRTKTAHTAAESGDKFYFALRNGLFLLRSSSFTWKEKIAQSMVIAEQARRYLLHERFRPHALRVLLRATWHGLVWDAQ
jgi:rhamnopyranosyl-N-acetylglucosaminyl-diphospho-decaprenol beta-1,3/1,4-galactofuranosyltransferase